MPDRMLTPPRSSKRPAGVETATSITSRSTELISIAMFSGSHIYA